MYTDATDRVATLTSETVSGWERRRRLLTGEYERVALELFAAHGYRNVTMEEIAAAAGISARTMFRYFPTKEDVLLSYPRRGVASVVTMIDALEPSGSPFETLWEHLSGYLLRQPSEPDVPNLWRAAAADVPEVAARVRGERVHALTEAIIGFFGRAAGAELGDDLHPRLVAGIIAGAELALIEAWGRSDHPLDEIVDAAAEALRPIAASLR